MYALRERRQHVTQEDFEFAVAKVCQRWLLSDFEITDEAFVGIEAKPRRKHFCQQTFLLSIHFHVYLYLIIYENFHQSQGAVE